jgi:hypothetical protein
MAYLDEVVLADYQDLTAQSETRKTKYGQLDLAIDSTAGVDYIPPSVIQKLSTASGQQAYKIPILKDTAATATIVPGFANIPINLGLADSYYFTAYDVFSGFRLFPSSFAGSQVDAKSYINDRMTKVTQAMAASAEGIINIVLEARKTQLLAGTLQISQGDGTFNFDIASNVLQISKSAVKDTMFANLNGLMIANKLEGDYRIVTNANGLTAAITNALKYGMNNQKNIIQFEPAIPSAMRYESHAIDPGSDIFNGYLVRDGGIGIYENYLWDFANGTQFGGKTWSVSDVPLQNIRMRVNVFRNTEATDATSLFAAGTNKNVLMTTFEEIAFWSRFYVVYRYNSDITTRANDIVKIQGLTTDPIGE